MIILKIKAVLFDLDGTLLPLTQDVFAATYFKTLTKKFGEYGFDPDLFSEALKQGVYAMATNDGSVTNEERFFTVFSKKLGTDMHKYDAEFLSFYQNEFQAIKSVCGFSEYSQKAVSTAKAKGFKCVAATAPMFPKIATESRIKWAGLNPDDFALCTTFENFGYSKPNP
jgi:FMN phosphatase YigB (HAD superfamily)